MTAGEPAPERWKSIFNPKQHKRWDVMFLASCVFAVSVDPLFLFIPVINEDKKCLWLDRRLKIVAICLRSITDTIYVANIIFQCYGLYGKGRAARQREQHDNALDDQQRAKRHLWSHLVVDILAILPLPQVLIPIIFTIVKGSNLFSVRRLLDAVVLLQYAPRVLRIYLSWRKLQGLDYKPVPIRVKAAFNFFLYILASYVLGAFWYLLSIERETTCWHKACKRHIECTSSSFKCGRSSEDYTFVNDYCPVKTENTTFFDFGIFFEAIQSGIVTSRNIPQRILYSFWWGHRNLSSLGQNLKTSTNVWENCFAILISILGMLLLLYFIENLKNYMQWINKSSKNITKIREIKDLESWISKIGQRCKGKRKKIISKVRRRILEENKDINMPNLFSCLPPPIKRKIQHCVCLPLLMKVPMLARRSEEDLKLISEHLQPVLYQKNVHIFRKGDVIDVMLFITSGSILTDMGEGSAHHIEKDQFLGEELLGWMSNCSSSPCVSKLPISNKNVKTITKVEAFALSFCDLKAVFPNLSQAASDAGASE